MSKEKQIDKQAIEEMAKVVKSSLDGLGCGNFNFTGDEISIMFAKALYNANYRKQSEAELIYEVNHFFDDYGDLIVYATAHCAECGTPYNGNHSIEQERIEQPEHEGYSADWNIDPEYWEKKVLERAKTKKLSRTFCPNCGAKMKGGAE